MDLKMKAIQSTAVAASLVVMAMVAQPNQTANDSDVAAVPVSLQTEKNVTGAAAGISLAVIDFEEDALDKAGLTSVEKAERSLVMAANEAGNSFAGMTEQMIDALNDAEDEAEQAAIEAMRRVEEEKRRAEEEALAAEAALNEEWQDRLLAEVDEYLNVRESADPESAVIGKLYKGDLAEIVEEGEEWTHVVSGNVDGYVNNEYCVTGADAYEYAIENLDTTAEVQTTGLRVRSDASEDASIVTTVSTGTELKVDTDAEEVEGWVAVVYRGTTRYVSADYVNTELKFGEGITIAEERAERERLAAEAAAKKAKQTTQAVTVTNSAVSASVDEVTLLAALIQCEAGNECYEGQVAVGAVVMNRVRSGGYPSSIFDVIYQRGQFGPAGSGKLATVLANGPKASCVQAAQDALGGTDNTGGATCFKRASCGHAGLVIGNHVFW